MFFDTRLLRDYNGVRCASGHLLCALDALLAVVLVSIKQERKTCTQQSHRPTIHNGTACSFVHHRTRCTVYLVVLSSVWIIQRIYTERSIPCDHDTPLALSRPSILHCCMRTYIHPYLTAFFSPLSPNTRLSNYCTSIPVRTQHGTFHSGRRFTLSFVYVHPQCSNYCCIVSSCCRSSEHRVHT